MIENKNSSVKNLEKIKAIQVNIRCCDTLIHVVEIIKQEHFIIFFTLSEEKSLSKKSNVIDE